jgi:uncharacterized protein with NAD-binding domain and iron-sulfur cluster
MVEHITARGGQVLTGKPIRSIELNADNSVKCLMMDDGTQATADIYVSAMPVDVLKRLIPSNWSQMPYFCQLSQLEGIPVINIQVSQSSRLLPLALFSNCTNIVISHNTTISRQSSLELLYQSY